MHTITILIKIFSGIRIFNANTKNINFVYLILLIIHYINLHF